jgi:alcohol dehydrogenase (cytochrome c)
MRTPLVPFLVASGVLLAQSASFVPVTGDMLLHPSPNDWLMYNRTYDSQRYSPLKQIDRTNVNQLRMVWTRGQSPGAQEGIPLVHNGIMYLMVPGAAIQALDATNGNLIWEYQRKVPDAQKTGARSKTIGIWQDMIYTTTPDSFLVALDAKTGEMRWETKTDSRGNISGAVIAGDKVISGGSCTGNHANCYISAHDAKTGKLLWKFYTAANTGEPGGDSWGDTPDDKRYTGTWGLPGTYDPTTNTVIWGVANPTPNTRMERHGGNAFAVPTSGPVDLFSDSTIAINADTGKLVWYYQHLPNDQWDLDWVFERQIVRMPVNGVVRPVIMTSGKQATYDVLDAETGKWIYSKDLGLQNIVSSIDPVTGKKNINQQTMPGDGQSKMVCPHVDGAKSWIPGSFNPDTKIMYVPLIEACMDLTPVIDGGRGLLSAGGRPTVRPRPDSDGKYGRVEAINMVTREVVWTERHRAPVSSGALDTAGGVIFNGSIDRYFRAYDDQTGKLLWETRLTDVPSNAPISYTVNGKQYIAIGVGNGGAQATGFTALVPEIQNVDRSPAVWVFQLP